METETRENGTRSADPGTAPAGRAEMHRDLTYDGPIDGDAFDRVLRIVRRLDEVDEVYESTGCECPEGRRSKKYSRYRNMVLGFLAEAGRRAARAALVVVNIREAARAAGLKFRGTARDAERRREELEWVADCCDRAVRAAEEGRTGGLLYVAAAVRHVRRAWWRVADVERAEVNARVREA